MTRFLDTAGSVAQGPARSLHWIRASPSLARASGEAGRGSRGDRIPRRGRPDEAGRRAATLGAFELDASPDCLRPTSNVGQSTSPRPALAGNIETGAVVADPDQNVTRIHGDSNADGRRLAVPDGVVESDLREPPRGTLDGQRRPALDAVHVDRHRRRSVGLKPLRKVLQGRDKPERLED